MSSEALSAYSFRQLDGPPAGASIGEMTAATAVDPVALASAEATAIRAEAHEQGLIEGHAAAEAAVRAEAAETLATLAGAARALRELRDEYLAGLESDALAVGLRLAEQIIAGAIAAEPRRILDVAGLALRRLTDRRAVTLIVNPAELDRLSEAVPALSAELGGIENLSVQADRRLRRGGVIARTDAGEIDATVESQLERARELIADELSDGEPVDGEPADSEPFSA